MKFGASLKKYRKLKKVTLRELSEKIGKSIGYLSDIEHGRKRPPDLEMVNKIEIFLSVEDGELLLIANRERNQTDKVFCPTCGKRLKCGGSL